VNETSERQRLTSRREEKKKKTMRFSICTVLRGLSTFKGGPASRKYLLTICEETTGIDKRGSKGVRV
jgi:hypothetical protein